MIVFCQIYTEPENSKNNLIVISIFDGGGGCLINRNVEFFALVESVDP